MNTAAVTRPRVIMKRSCPWALMAEMMFSLNRAPVVDTFAALGGKAVALARERGLGKEFSIDDWYEDER